MSRRDDWTRFVGLSEFEACLGPGEGPLITPGRIGRRQGRQWRCVGSGRLYTPWRWLWRRRVERSQCLVTITAPPRTDPATLAALGRLAQASIAAVENGELGELAEDAGPWCGVCGAELERVECDTCGGEGGRDGDELMSEDPLWYDGVDWEDCADCKGQGAFWECPNAPHLAAGEEGG